MDRLELIGEMRLLEAEHDRVRQIAEQLPRFCLRADEQAPCESCGTLLVSQCTNTVANTLVVLRSFSTMHFANEERVMKLACPAREFEQRFGTHTEDHAELSSELTRISAQAASTPPASMIGDMTQLVLRWLHTHLTSYDEVLIRYLDGACH
jgi:hemerythrin